MPESENIVTSSPVDTSRRLAKVAIDRDSLIRLLGLPKSTKFHKAEWNVGRNAIELIIEHKDIYDVGPAPAVAIPEITYSAENARPRFQNWNQ